MFRSSLNRPAPRLLVRTALIALLGLGVARTVLADAALSPRVRSTSPYIRGIIDEAIGRSRTLLRLIQAIEATDGIVYVEPGLCGHGVRACLSLSVTNAGAFRVLRIVVDPSQAAWNLMASIGHELQHALEVLAEPTLIDARAVYLYYSREAPTTRRTFETQAAIKAGDAVFAEVRSFLRRAAN